MKKTKSSESAASRSGKVQTWNVLVIMSILGATGLLVAQTTDVRPSDPPMPSAVQIAQEAAAPDSAPLVSPVLEPAKPETAGKTISLTAADLVRADEPEIGAKVSLFSKNTVTVPEAEPDKTVADALEEIAKSAGRRLEYLATNVVDVLSGQYERPIEGATSSPSELFGMLLPAGYSSWMHDNGVYLFVGTEEDVNRKRTEFEVERLRNNHTRIAFSASDMTLYDAVLRVKSLCKANILTQFMDKDDQHSDAVSQDGSFVTVDGLGTAGTNAVVNCRRITYSTDGAEMEWRTVLSSILEPDYTFDEVDGKVRVATRERFAAMKKRDQDAKPMGLRYVRVYHANPEEIVERLKTMGVTQNSRASIQVAPYQEKSKKDNVNSFRHNLSSSSSRLSIGGTTVGDSSSSSSGSWGNLLRPKNPPAILVYDNEENLDRVESTIRTMDVRDKQVLIEAIVLSLTDNGSRQLGMKLDEMGFGNLPILGVSFMNSHVNSHASSSSHTWAHTDDRYNGGSRTIVRSDGSDTRETPETLNNGKANYWTTGAGVTVNDAFNGLSSVNNESSRNRTFSSVLGPLDFKFILEMVEENKYGKALSSPVITIGDHAEAMIHVGNVRPIVQTEVTYSGDNSTPVQSYEWEELLLGLHMWVGPEVTSDGGAVRLWVHPKITSDDHNDVTAPDGSTYPRLSSQELDTRVTVLSGATLLLGGLTETSESETRKKIPLLGDIPLLGRLFRWNSRSSERRNLVILIRPTVLDDDAPETGFEAPANAIIDPMMSASGRNLKDVVFNEEDDAMKRREKAVVKAVREKILGDEAEDAEVSINVDAASEADETEAAASEVEEAAPGEDPAGASITVAEATE